MFAVLFIWVCASLGKLRGALVWELLKIAFMIAFVVGCFVQALGGH
jgi:hypothetical protein